MFLYNALSHSSELVKMVCINVTNRKGLAVQIICDITIIVLLCTVSVAIHYGIEPHRRRFFCDDKSLKHPDVEDTVPNSYLLSIGPALNIIVILLVEFTLREDRNTCLISPKMPNDYVEKSWGLRSYRHIVIFIFGFVATLDFTELGKTTTGRLRPYFLTLCDPDLTKTNCTALVTEEVCQTTDLKGLKKARRGFPSGHASLCVYCAMFVVLYLQYRFTCTKRLLLVRPVVQMVLCGVSVWVCLTRVADNKHFAGDVVAGALLGLTLALLMVWYLSSPRPPSTHSLTTASASDNMLDLHSPKTSFPLHNSQASLALTDTEAGDQRSQASSGDKAGQALPSPPSTKQAPPSKMDAKRSKASSSKGANQRDGKLDV